ncbi:MAG: FAD-dependent oxidoreductase [Pseudomonadota bacterium]
MDEIAIIGAGLAGVTAARVVAAAGWPVRIFDKSRGLGGRLATRRGPGFSLDHGAPGVQATDPAFAAALAGAGGVQDPGLGFVGQPGMSGLVKAMATGLTVETGVEIMGLADAGSRLTLIDQAGRGHGPFGHVISAIPAPQARRLTRDVAAADRMLARVVMAPVWSLLMVFDDLATPPTTLPDPIESLIHNSAKPGRPAEPCTWVAHASEAWSRHNLERAREDIAADLAHGLAPLPATHHLAAHRWRYARTETPLGAPYLEALDGRVLFGGDWALGRMAQDAFASGRAMGRAIAG